LTVSPEQPDRKSDVGKERIPKDAKYGVQNQHTISALSPKWMQDQATQSRYNAETRF